MIKKITVKEHGEVIPNTYYFNDDLNIVTGKNGAGKTTFLKLAWYIFSGNLEMAAQEIRFEKVDLETDRYIFKVINKLEERNSKENLFEAANKIANYKRKRDREYFYSNKYERAVSLQLDIYDKLEQREILEGIDEMTLEEFKDIISNLNKDSLFFPTFRRIEGGFLTEDSGDMYFSRSNIESSLNSLSEIISAYGHRFITSISTVDIVDLLTKQYAAISEDINSNYIEYSKNIENRILAHSSNNNNLNNQELLEQANKVLQDIEFSIHNATQFRKDKLKPFDVLNQIIGDIFHMKGIKVAENITLGKSKEAILSDSLSAGEKQMLSFICYNTFYKDSVIFIDEPEISLHVDWQRILIETLLSQKSGNQFIIATHSPFIYSNYIDKEIILDEDRGGY